MASSRDIIDALIRRRPAERMGVHDHPWRETLQAWAGQGMPRNAEGNPVDPAELFGFDLAGCGGWIAWQPKSGPEEVIEETAEWRLVRNGAGAALKWWKNKSGTPEHVDFLMKDRATWERDYRPHVAEFQRGRAGNLDAVRDALAARRRQGKWTYFGDLCIWEIMRASLGDLGMFMALLDDPDWIRDFNRVYVDLFKNAYRVLIEEGGKPDGIMLHDDLGYRDRLFCSPDVLEELFFPYYAELVAFFHSYDLPVILHSCGYQEPMIPLAVAAGFDALNPMEVKAGNDVLRYAERFGRDLLFVGGLDARVLESGDRPRIRAEVLRLVRGMKERGARFVFGSDHSISPNVRYEDYRLAVEVFREEMYY